MEGVNKVIRTVKLRWPTGTTLKGEQAQGIIKVWKTESKAIAKKQSDFVVLSRTVERRVASTRQEIQFSAGELRKAKGQYKKTKNPVAKRRWARRMVLANELHRYVRQSHQMMDATVERIKDAIEDGQLVGKLVEQRIADAEVYYQMNGQLKLVGAALAAARKQNAMPEIEYKNLEFNMEALEAQINDKEDDALLLEAEAILKEPEDK